MYLHLLIENYPMAHNLVRFKFKLEQVWLKNAVDGIRFRYPPRLPELQRILDSWKLIHLTLLYLSDSDFILVIVHTTLQNKHIMYSTFPFHGAMTILMLYIEGMMLLRIWITDLEIPLGNLKVNSTWRLFCPLNKLSTHCQKSSIFIFVHLHSLSNM
jgi:hypothetical protein